MVITYESLLWSYGIVYSMTWLKKLLKIQRVQEKINLAEILPNRKFLILHMPKVQNYFIICHHNKPSNGFFK